MNNQRRKVISYQQALTALKDGATLRYSWITAHYYIRWPIGERGIRETATVRAVTGRKLITESCEKAPYEGDLADTYHIKAEAIQ